MKKTLLRMIITGLTCGAAFQALSQGYIVPNGVVYGGFNFGGYLVNVRHDPTDSLYTGFVLRPQSMSTFRFDPVVDVGVRVFFVSFNDPVSVQPILAQGYTELLNPNTYVFADGAPFLVGLYTGNQNFHPPDGIYSDPLFGWARLVNNNGVIQLLDSALEYKGGGIYAGTQNIIPVPEPNGFALAALGALLYAVNRCRYSSR